MGSSCWHCRGVGAIWGTLIEMYLLTYKRICPINFEDVQLNSQYGIIRHGGNNIFHTMLAYSGMRIASRVNPGIFVIYTFAASFATSFYQCIFPQY